MSGRHREARVEVGAPSLTQLSSCGGMLGRFRLDDLMARDAASSVWRATDLRLQRPVMIRIVLPQDPRIDDIRVAACTAARVTDREVARVLDVLDVGGSLVVVTEWADAITLTEELARPISSHRAIEIALGVARAVQSIHSAGSSHGRITPSAVLLTSDGEVKLRGHAVAAALWGPVGGNKPVDADLVGVGAVLMAGLTGRWPLGPTDGLRGAPTVSGFVSTPRQLVADIPSSLDVIAARCLASGTGRRTRPGIAPFVDINAVIGSLVSAQHDLGSRINRSRPSGSRGWRRVGGALAAASAVALVGITGIGLTTLSTNESRGAASSSDDGVWKPPPTPVALDPEVRQLPNEQPVRIERLWALADGPPRRLVRSTRAVAAATDGNPASAWYTPKFATATAVTGSGVALVADLGGPQRVKAIDIGLVGGSSDIVVSASLDPPNARPEGVTIAELVGATPLTTIRVPRAVTARYLVIYFKRLPPANGGYQGGVTNIAIRGILS